MKRTFSFALLTTIVLTACSKKNDNGPIGSVTINGKAYSTVKIGNLTWTSQNYDGPGGAASSTNNEATIGKFYQVEELDNIVLPPGWRIPTQSDFNNLLRLQGTVTDEDNGNLDLDEADSGHLRATSSWDINGDNLSGFNGLSAGADEAGVVYGLKVAAYFWSSTPGPNSVDGATQCVLALTVSPGSFPNYINHEDAFTYSEEVQNYGVNLRFVKDN